MIVNIILPPFIFANFVKNSKFTYLDQKVNIKKSEGIFLHQLSKFNEAKDLYLYDCCPFYLRENI